MMRRAVFVSTIGAAIPYLSVAIGLYAAHSAWAAILMYHFGIVVSISATGWSVRLRRVRLGWRMGAVVMAAATAAMAGVALYVMWPAVDATAAVGGLRRVLDRFGLYGHSWTVFAVYYATVHPFVEELYWRGGDTGRVEAPVWQDAAFAGYHVLVLPFFVRAVWVGVIFAVLLCASWMWRVAARRFGGLGVPLISHAAADAGIVVAATVLAGGG